MRKVSGALLVALGTFLLVAAALGQFWAPLRAERTPLDVDTTTRLAGTAAKLDPASGKVQHFDVKATSVTKADSTRSTGSVISFVTTSCLVVDRDHVPDCVGASDPQKRLVTASTDVFATDRHTAESVVGASYTGSRAVAHTGLVNKWPFDTRRTTYPLWDSTLARTVPAVYKAQQSIDGLDTYRFDVDVPPTKAQVVTGVSGLYSTQQSVWVEPRTGAIIKQTQHQVRTMANGDPILDLDLAYTALTVRAAADQAKSNVTGLRLVTQVLPVAGLVGGVVLLLGGLALLLTGRRRGAHSG